MRTSVKDLKLNPISDIDTPPLAPPILHHTSTTPSAQSRTVPVKRTAPNNSLSPSSARKQRRNAIIDLAQSVPTDLGEFISRDIKLLDTLGWHGLVAHRRPSSDFTSLEHVQHTARRLLRFYKHQGAPVKFDTPPWTRQQI